MKKPQILVVEDNQDNLRILTDELKGRGYRVITALDGEEALGQVDSNKVDLVILDLTIPVIDGWEVATRLKAQKKTCTIPIIAFTGHVMPGDESKALQAGCDAFIPKPTAPDSVVDEIHNILTKRDRSS